jgi:hypothetical protein
MSDNVSDRASDPLNPPAFDEAGRSAEPRSVDPRLRREFLRQLAMTSVTIPVIGGMSLAAEKKKKKVDDSSSAPAVHTASKSTKSSKGHSEAVRKKNQGARVDPRTGEPMDQGRDPMADGSSAGGGDPEAKKVVDKPLPELYKHWNAQNFQQIQTDENAHVAFLVKALGSSARPTPSFQGLEQSTVHEFATVSRALENTGVGAYLGALPLLAGSTAGLQYLSAAGSIALIEARHAGYLNTLIDLSVVDDIEGQVSSFEVALTPQQVVSLAGPFITDLNGGPPLIPSGGLSNPIDILNFALALEYLEAAFYNINVPNLLKVLEQ